MPVENLRPGTVFADRFEIERAVGSGGMSIVYRARDRFSGDLVALKLLQTVTLGPNETERFAREAQLLSELRHPNIVRYVSHGQTRDGQNFLAMEWLDGEDLGQRLVRGPLSLRECVILLQRVAEGLVASHQRGIVHRGLKLSPPATGKNWRTAMWELCVNSSRALFRSSTVKNRSCQG